MFPWSPIFFLNDKIMTHNLCFAIGLGRKELARKCYIRNKIEKLETVEIPE